ncbi:MAG: hypothetical protein GY768_31655, partial [Planctomycetaceae bacterium]|nr:hypothetical protein [Planctomycetaceae bacterium]
LSNAELKEKTNPEPPSVNQDGRYESYDDYARTCGLLLREECLQPLRNGLRKLVAGKPLPPGIPSYGPITRFVAIAVDPGGLRVKIETPDKRVAPERLWFGNLLYLVRGREILTTATVRHHGYNQEDKRLVIDLVLGGELTKTSQILNNLLLSPRRIRIVESPNYFRANEPAIRRFQEGPNPDIPLWAALGSTKTSTPNYLITSNLHDHLQKCLQEQPGWDGSQRDAVIQSLDRNISLIQGPPGCGKTHVGVGLLKTLVTEIPKEVRGTILLLSYRNRALDDVIRKGVKVLPTDSLCRTGRIPA